MKRSLISLLFIILIMGGLQAQNFKFGIRGGMNFTSLPSTKDFQFEDFRFTSLPDSYTGYHFGVMSQFVFTGFFVQPELLYSRTGIEMRREIIAGNPANGAEEIYFTQEYEHLNLPVLLGLKIGPLRVGAGPVFSLLLDDSHDFPTVQEFRQEINNATVGFQAGIGLDLASLVLDLKYQAALTRYGDSIIIDGQSFSYDTRPRQFIFSIGLVF